MELDQPHHHHLHHVHHHHHHRHDHYHHDHDPLRSNLQKIHADVYGGGHGTISSPKSSLSSTYDDDEDDDRLRNISVESFVDVVDKAGLRRSIDDPTKKKLRWLRSQIIGSNAEFESPFGRRLLTYADHTASGRSLQFIENYIANDVLPFYGNSHTSDSYVGYHTTNKVHVAANYIKKCLGGGEEDALIFCGSGTTAAIKRLQEVMGIAIPSILRERVLKHCLKSHERWVVFVGPYEHHSNILSWRQSLAEVVEIGLDRSGLIDIEALTRKLEFYKSKNRPILGSFSACSNVTGICSDTRAIARLLHQFGGFVCFDFAASGPYARIEMKSGEMDGYDAIFLSTHKFVGGPGSPGILLMRKALYRLGSSPPSTCGGGTVHFVNGFDDKDTIYADDIEEREDAGTPQIIQKIRAALAFRVKEYMGYKAIEKLENSYGQRALGRLLPNPNIWILGSTTAKRLPILSFLIYSTSQHSSSAAAANKMGKPLHGPFVAKLLNDLFGIQARGGCACAGPYGHSLLNVDKPRSLAFRSAIEKGYGGIKPGWTRVSFPYYMSEEEFDFILTAIEFVAVYGQRFLPLYHFSWRSGSWTFKKNAPLRRLDQYDNINSSSEPYSLTSMTEALSLEDGDMMKSSPPDKARKKDVLSKYTDYLRMAKHTASLLPKFPTHKRRIPKDLDIGLVPFEV